MIPVVGVFESRLTAAHGMERIKRIGISLENISVLTPASSDEQIAAAPVSDTEQPGMGAAVGAVVGGALGSAGGFGAGAALASLLVPGVGPVLLVGGLLGASLLGLGGAAGGASAGGAMEGIVSGVPRDELYVYEDALRQGRTVIIVQAKDDLQAEAARQGLFETGAESIDAAREKWWIGLRSAEKESYASNGDFDVDEQYYRKGFEAAQSPAVRGKSYEEALEYLTRRYQISASNAAFCKGFERGRQYSEGLRNRNSYSAG